MKPLPAMAINGKFLAAQPTGVHRVAGELVHALARAAARRPGEIDLELWVPRDAARAADAFALPKRVIGPFVHIPWEQLSLPLRDRRRLLLNLCNIGPVLRGNAMTMIHDAQVHATPQSYSRAFRLWYKAVQPLLGRFNQRVLTVSQTSRSDIANAGIAPADRIEVIHNGVDHMLRFEPDSGIMDRLGLRARRFVLAVASAQAHKNVALLLRAFADARLAGLELVLVGAMTAPDLARLGIALPASAHLTGRISDAELRALYEQALCLAFPSRTEGFGLPPLEAMLLGCPAVVAPCGALPEVCGDAVTYADPDDPAPWIEAILALHERPGLRDAMWRKGRQHAGTFTWDRAAERLLDVVAAWHGQSAAR